MNGKPDGGSAFPIWMRDDTSYSFQEGMSYRQYLIAHAPPVPNEFGHQRIQIIGTLSNGLTGPTWIDEPRQSRQARWALAYADAIIALCK